MAAGFQVGSPSQEHGPPSTMKSISGYILTMALGKISIIFLFIMRCVASC